MKRVVINIRASKNISGLVKIPVTSPAGLMKFFFLMLSPDPFPIVSKLIRAFVVASLILFPAGADPGFEKGGFDVIPKSDTGGATDNF